MSWPLTKKLAREAFKKPSPSRASGFTVTADGRAVVIAGYDEKVSMVLHTMGDLYRVKGLCEAAIAHRKRHHGG